jgi:hypothetical protein
MAAGLPGELATGFPIERRRILTPMCQKQQHVFSRIVIF